MRSQHELFHSPNEVRLTIADRPTPKAYAREALGATMPMWRVQTEGYLDGRAQPIGVVSSNAGFFDSPDVEWISGGVNSKNSQAVAIGRHGNFLHWGFAASPTYLTDEAKLVFVNAVHYIAKFDGKPPIARKQRGTAMRSYVEDALASISDEGHRATVARYRQLAEDHVERQRKIRARIDAGEQVDRFDRQLLDMDPPKTPGRFDRIKRYVPQQDWSAIADDEPAIREYFTARMPFLRPAGWFELVVDEQLRSFGIANDDIAMLQKAIAALQAGDRAETARTLLERYTDREFATAAEWQTWFDDNRERLFFTESGGYRWLVDTTDQEASRDVTATAMASVPATSPQQPLTATLTVQAGADGAAVAIVTLRIHDGWHAYLETSRQSSNHAVRLSLRLPDGARQVGEWQPPAGHPDPDDPGTIQLAGTVQYRCALGNVARGAEIACELHYQVCDDERCNVPTDTMLTTDVTTEDNR